MSLNQRILSEMIRKKINIFCYESIDSTNDEAKRKAESLSYEPSVFVSEEQTAGRGRRGHSFYSPETGLYMTVLLPVKEMCGIQKITCAAATATLEAIEKLTENKAQIKWVNDIYVAGRKVAGILCELISDRENRPRAVIVGIGINLTTADFPAEFAPRAGSIGKLDKNLLCAAVTENLIAEYEQLSENHFLKKYTERSMALGKTVSYEKNGVIHTAKAVKITPDGGLAVIEKGEEVVLSSGEISILIQHS